MATTTTRQLKKPLDLGSDNDSDNEKGEDVGGPTRAGSKRKGNAFSTFGTSGGAMGKKKRVNPFLRASSNAGGPPRKKLESTTMKPGQAFGTDTKASPTLTLNDGSGAIEEGRKEEGGNSEANAKDHDEEEEDDYMSMAIPADSASKGNKETLTEKQRRKQRESEIKGRPLSKAELAKIEKERREEALQKSLLDGVSKEEKMRNRGYKMMKAMGWSEEESGLGRKKEVEKMNIIPTGTTIPAGSTGEIDDEDELKGAGGAAGGITTPQEFNSSSGTSLRQPITEPIALIMKEDRSGIGHLTSEKKKFSQRLKSMGALPSESTGSEGGGLQQPLETPESYRERMRQEREEKRHEAQFYAAQKILEAFDTDSNSTPPDNSHPGNDAAGSNSYITSADKTALPNTRPIITVPLLYRSLVKHRESKERDKRARYEFLSSLSALSNPAITSQRLPGYDYDSDERRALGQGPRMVEDEYDLDEEVDEELEEFNRKGFDERLELVLVELRSRWNYCFWCKCRYRDEEEMREACPGEEEDLHG